jgi:hypothetical protein
VLRHPDVVLDFLVRDDPADEQEVEKAVVSSFDTAGRGGACRIRLTSTAMGNTPVARKPRRSSSWRL